MMCAYRQAVAGMVLALGLATAAPAPNPSWTGKVALIKNAGLTLVDDPKKGQPQNVAVLSLISYTVLADRDGWLKLREHNVEGWVRKADMVLLEDAAAHYTKLIREKPNDASLYNSRAAAARLRGMADD